MWGLDSGGGIFYAWSINILHASFGEWWAERDDYSSARCKTGVKGPNGKRGVNSLFKILQTQLDKCVSKTNGEAILALAQLNYASHLHKSSKKAKHKVTTRKHN